MMKPTIHLNGTSSDELSRQLEKVYVACSELIDALSNARPHGRDYYPQGDDAIGKASAEHEARIAAVTKIREDALEINRDF